MTRRACVVLPPIAIADSWHTDNLRRGLCMVASSLDEAGWQVLLIDPEAADSLESREGSATVRRGISNDGIPLASGPGPGAYTQTLRDGYRIARSLRHETMDLILAPLWRGIAQPLLMSRATGEAFTECTLLLLGDPPSAWRLRRDGTLLGDIGPLVDDALEKTALRFADGVICSSRKSAEAVREFSANELHISIMPLPPLHLGQARGRRNPGGGFHEIVFVGPLSGRYGAPQFLDAIEQLDQEGALAQCSVTFLGPSRDAAPGLSKMLLGLRAQHWNVPFKVVDAATLTSAWEYLQGADVLPVFAADNPHDDVLFNTAVAAGLLMIVAADPAQGGGDHGVEPGWGGTELARALSHALAQEGVTAAVPPANPDWPAELERWCRSRELEKLVSTGLDRLPRLSVCITHRDRPELLRNALASVACNTIHAEVVVLDHGSGGRETAVMFEQLEKQQSNDFLLKRHDKALPQQAAWTFAAQAASGDVLVFLDDDNALTPDGLARLSEAFRYDRFDIVVSCLDLYDGLVSDRRPDARLIFLGDAGSAGLFFNGFGDTSMAIRRDKFLQISEFLPRTITVASPDWMFLARARAIGLRIGVLQQPAFRYSRGTSDSRNKWRKRDLEGARAAVLNAYSGAIDFELIARLGQGTTSVLFDD
jgi:hypothetical protein